MGARPDDLPPSTPGPDVGPAPRRRLPRCAPHPAGHPDIRDGRRHAGPLLEPVIWRQWPSARTASAANVEAIERLAELPDRAKARLVQAVARIYVGPGGVPDLDYLQHLRGNGEGRPPGTTWDQVAGVCWPELEIIAIGDIPSRSACVSLHEVGHGLAHADALTEQRDFQAMFAYCRSALTDPLYEQLIGEFAAESFARSFMPDKRPLVSWLGGNESRALAVRAYWMRRYG